MRKECGFRFIRRIRNVSSKNRSLFIHSIVSNDSLSGQRRPWSDCANAQADLRLRYPHMLADTFSHGVVYIITIKVSIKHWINSPTLYWKSPFSVLGMSGYLIIISKENGWTICNSGEPWSDVTFCGVWSGSALFASYPFRDLQSLMS